MADEGPAEVVEDAEGTEAEARLRALPIVQPERAVHAGFGTRLTAALIDAAILMAVMILVAGAFWVFDSGYVPLSLETGGQWSRASVFFWTLAGLLILGYNTLCVVATGQTLGKQLMGVMVLRQDGVSVGPGMAAARALAAFVSAAALGLGFWAVLWDKDRRGWHDRIAGTDAVVLGERRPDGDQSDGP